MKKGLALIGITAAVIAVYFIFIKKDENVVEVPKQQALAQGIHSEMFNKSINNVLDGYFNLKNP